MQHVSVAVDAPLDAVPAARTRFALRLLVAFAAIVAVIALLTAVAVHASLGQDAALVAALGTAAILLTMATATWILRSIVRPLAPVTEALGRLSRGDLTGQVETRGSGELLVLAEALETVRARLQGVVNEVRTATFKVTMNVNQTARDNEALSARTDTQVDSLQHTAASMEQLTATVRQNAGTADQAHSLVETARARAEQGGEAMREVVATMDSIRGSSHSIREIIGVIDGIAFQTNILALNAAVEAARAGDQGRGFAVVAAEVRSLAQRSAEAARDIKALIGASVEQVDAGGARVDNAGRAMADIVQAVRQVADLIAEIHHSSREQSNGIESVNAAMARIDGATQENAILVGAANRTAQALRERTDTLRKSVAVFDTGEREFGNAQEAVELVRRGCEFLRAHGPEAFLADVNKLDQGSFLLRDLSLWVVGVNDGVFVAHGNNAGRVGSGPEMKDADGKCHPLEFARVARQQGEGWVDYRWPHVLTREIRTRRAFVRREGDLAIACPFFLED